MLGRAALLAHQSQSFEMCSSWPSMLIAHGMSMRGTDVNLCVTVDVRGMAKKPCREEESANFRSLGDISALRTQFVARQNTDGTVAITRRQQNILDHGLRHCLLKPRAMVQSSFLMDAQAPRGDLEVGFEFIGVVSPSQRGHLLEP